MHAMTAATTSPATPAASAPNVGASANAPPALKERKSVAVVRKPTEYQRHIPTAPAGRQIRLQPTAYATVDADCNQSYSRGYNIKMSLHQSRWFRLLAAACALSTCCSCGAPLTGWTNDNPARATERR